MERRICNKCGVEKDESEFHKSKSGKYGFINRCKICSKLDNDRIRYTPEKIYSRYRSSAKNRGLIFVITFKEFMTFWRKDCYYCGDKIETIGLDRVNNDIGYEIGNVVSCCYECNRMKINKSISNFIYRCKLIAKRFENVGS